MVVHPGSDRVSRARPYSGTATGESLRVGVRGPNPLRPAFPCRSAARATSPPGAEAPGRAALQPRRREALRPLSARRFGRRPLSLAATRGIS